MLADRGGTRESFMILDGETIGRGNEVLMYQYGLLYYSADARVVTNGVQTGK
jgi:hypothetical protein